MNPLSCNSLKAFFLTCLFKILLLYSEADIIGNLKADINATPRAYPTNYIAYPSWVTGTGTYNTSSQCIILPETMTILSKYKSSLTQPSPTFPKGESDKFGTLYTLTETDSYWPTGFQKNFSMMDFIQNYVNMRRRAQKPPCKVRSC